MSKSFDVVVIGGGVIGCSAAFHLAERGLKVAVLERDQLGCGATGRSSAIIRQHYSNELTARMALHSLHDFQQFEERVGAPCGFRETGFLALAPSRDEPALRANLALQQHVGINTQFLTPYEIRELVPGMDTSDLAGAAFEPESGYADPHLTVQGYANAARRFGAQFFQRTAVTAIRFADGRVEAVEAKGEQFVAPSVVNCAGPWGARVAAMVDISLPVESCRAQVAVFRRPPECGGDSPVVMDFANATYFRSETGDLSLVGVIDPGEANDVVKPDAYPEHCDPGFISDVGARWIQRQPEMELAESRGGYAGLYAVTPDWHPIIDEAPSGTGHFVCTGFSGHGFKLAPAVGVMVADMVTREPAPAFATQMFRLDRYRENEVVQGQYAYSITG